MTQPDSPASEARTLVRSADSGILSTHSVELAGYPFGSVTPFVTSVEGRIAVYVSLIAQHTKNMQGNPKVCLTVLAPEAPPNSGLDKQASGRVTVIGDASRVPDADLEEVEDRYFTFFPQSTSYKETHDFDFYVIEPVRVRFIGGFGKIHWLERQEWMGASPSWKHNQAAILDHMNTDHGQALEDIHRHYCGHSGAHGASSTPPQMIALDPEGFHLRRGGRISYLPFQRRCETTDHVRGEMVRMARTAKPKG